MISEKLVVTKPSECESYGKMPKKRGIVCAACRVFDGCALETMKRDFAKRGILIEKVKVVAP